jgi:heptaprenyl diphosphate synthase
MNGRHSENGKRHTGAYRIALLGLLVALAVVLSLTESLLPIPAPVPGIRLGLSNIVVMFALLNLRRTDALAVALLKALFVAVTRGVTAGLLSLTGGLAALGVMALILLLFKDKATYVLISVAGAVFHNMGQIAMASVILQTALWPYLPVLLISGIVTGFATSVLLKLTSPVFQRLRLK